MVYIPCEPTLDAISIQTLLGGLVPLLPQGLSTQQVMSK